MTSVCVCVCEHICTCSEQRFHARWRLRGLEHFADVLLGQRGLASALSLGVLLLPPLEVLGRDKQGQTGENRKGLGRRNAARGGECPSSVAREVQRNRVIVGEMGRKDWREGL